ncbi:hypothetical protein MXMO3_01677 [Maritalea myrionectae]|uniref:Uncharacterized protein n=1 Tax=Maritalea myrionectae TaxID=454601 RepID=A0A2R4ME02_9HYPH|nr:hypothetical protein [Maritalea myrionectae]AVX04203.1 hypothetical protein MXMO3_01677 [Maritalea myrionectae]
MSNVDKIIHAFGGLRQTSKALGHKHASTVQHWVKTGAIPHWRIQEIEQAAERHSVSIDDAWLNDFRQGAA